MHSHNNESTCLFIKQAYKPPLQGEDTILEVIIALISVTLAYCFAPIIFKQPEEQSFDQYESFTFLLVYLHKYRLEKIGGKKKERKKERILRKVLKKPKLKSCRFYLFKYKRIL